MLLALLRKLSRTRRRGGVMVPRGDSESTVGAGPPVHDVYLSYVERDSDAASEVSRAIEAVGSRCWLASRDVAPGMIQSEAVLEAVRGCRLAVLVFSSSSNTSPRIRREMELISRFRVQLLVVRVEEVAPSDISEWFQTLPNWFDGCASNEKRDLPQLGQLVQDALMRGHEAKQDEEEVNDRVLRTLNVSSFSQLAECVDQLDWSRKTMGRLAPEVVWILPHLDRVARHAAQSQSVSTMHARADALAIGLQLLSLVQKELTKASVGRVLDRLRRIVALWREMFAGEYEPIRVEAAIQRPIVNPFIFGNPVAGTEMNLFSGRRDIVRQLEQSALGSTRAPALLLHGARRMGKSSILNQLPRLLGPDLAPAIIDCQNPAVVASPSSILRYFSQAISQGLRRRRIEVDPLTTDALKSEPFVAFDDWLVRIEESIPARMRIMLCLDEYERLQSTLDAGWGWAVLDGLRHLLQHRQQIMLIFTGARTFPEMGPAWTDRFISVRRVRVNFLKRDETIRLLTSPVPEFEMLYAPEALDAMVQVTNGQPFLTQAVGFELVHWMNERRRRVVTVKDVVAAVGRALISGDSYFANVWTDAGERGQMLLRRLSDGEPVPAKSRTVAMLKHQDVLTENGEFAVPMLKAWVRRQSAGVVLST